MKTNRVARIGASIRSGLPALGKAAAWITLAASFAVQAATSTSLCLPEPYPIPGLSGPPDWLTPTNNIWNGLATNATTVDWMNDPRWTGSLSRQYGGGSAYDVNFRAVASGKTLYISWNVRVDPNLGSLYIGFFREDTTNTNTPSTTATASDPAGTVIEIDAKAGATCTGDFASCPKDASTGGAPYAPPVALGANATISVYTESAANSWVAATPTWFNTVLSYIRISKLPFDTSNNAQTWNIEMKIPIDPANAAGPDLLSSNPKGFLYWHDVDVKMPDNSSTPYTWPNDTSKYAVNKSAVLSHKFPDPFDTTKPWAEVQYQSDGSCVGQGVGFTDYLQIGNHNTVDSSDDEIRATGANTFFAKPVNNFNGTIAASDLTARFRIADWGSTFDPNAAWSDIPKLNSVPFAGTTPMGAIDIEAPLDLTSPNATPPDNAVWQFACGFTGQIPGTVYATCSNATPTKATDNCMIVDLGGSMPIFSNSIKRNMSVVHASDFSRNAQINIVGLPPISSAPRDVYLFVERQNMPGFPTYGTGSTTLPTTTPLPVITPVEYDGRPNTKGNANGNGYGNGGGGGGASSPGNGGGQGTTAPVTSLAPGVQLTKLMPTEIVHVYDDTGRKITVNGVDQAVLSPQDSFGYLVEHDGPFFGWISSLVGMNGATVTKLAPDFYKISVPEGGKVMITTGVSTVDLHTWWLWAILLLILLLIWLVVRLIQKATGP